MAQHITPDALPLRHVTRVQPHHTHLQHSTARTQDERPKTECNAAYAGQLRLLQKQLPMQLTPLLPPGAGLQCGLAVPGGSSA